MLLFGKRHDGEQEENVLLVFGQSAGPRGRLSRAPPASEPHALKREEVGKASAHVSSSVTGSALASVVAVCVPAVAASVSS